MSPRNEVFQAVPFDAASDAKEPLIATGGDAEEEDHAGFEERKKVSSLKLYSLFLGLIVGVFIEFSHLGAFVLALDFGMMKSNTAVYVFSLLSILFTVASLFLIISIIRNVGRSEGLLEDMILRLECLFVMGFSAGICLTWILSDILLGMRAHVYGDFFEITMVFGVWYDFKVTKASATDSKPSSTRSLTAAEQTIMIV